MRRAYLTSQPMLRKLLACLALLTGLAAAGAPAQAEVASAVASRLEVSMAAPAAARVASVVAPATPGKRERATRPDPIARPAPCTPATVELGSDRARE